LVAVRRSGRDYPLPVEQKGTPMIHYPRPEPRQLSDSERNQIWDLAHEADEPCPICGDMVAPFPTSPNGGWKWPHGELNGEPLCEECQDSEMIPVLEELDELRGRMLKLEIQMAQMQIVHGS
jgi:hypothetical protein